MAKEEEQKKYLAQNKTKAFDIMKSQKKLNVFVEIYNNLCMPCRLKVKRKPSMKLNAYCKKCQVMIKEKGGGLE